tara:strand:- start:566 stop:691 length:126 start_codon:yes stop_codon:yes gene_type:complete
MMHLSQCIAIFETDNSEFGISVIVMFIFSQYKNEIIDLVSS